MLKQLDGSLSVSIDFDSWLGMRDKDSRNPELAVYLLIGHIRILDIGLMRLMRGVFSNATHMKLFLMIFPRISLHCMLVLVQNREYEIRSIIMHFTRHSQFLGHESLTVRAAMPTVRSSIARCKFSHAVTVAGLPTGFSFQKPPCFFFLQTYVIRFHWS